MDISGCSGVSLSYSQNASENSLFSVFRTKGLIYETLKVETLESLLEAGAHINEVEPKDSTNFLQRLIIKEFSFKDTEGEEFKKIVAWLCDKGLDIDHQDVEGRTALHLAVLEDEFSLAAYLVERGANRAIFDNYGKTPFDIENNFTPSYISESDAAEREKVLKLLLPTKTI